MQLKEIKHWNEVLKKPFSSVKFFEEGHKYIIEGEEHRNIKSVSSLMKYFYEPFDTEKIALQWATARDLEVEDVKLAWKGEGDISTIHGSKVHLFAEDYIKWKYFNNKKRPTVFDKQSLGVLQFINDLPSYLIPVATELVMYSPTHWYSGTCDGILFNTKNNKFVIFDWKGLPLDTPILTLNGWKKMGDLSLQDIVFDKDGNITKINHISEIKNKKCLKIKFDNNEEIISDYEHRWLVFSGFGKYEKEKVMTSQDIFNFYNTFNGGKPKHSKDFLKIKNTKPLNLKEVDLPIDPYVFGIWLGDGHSADAKITQANKKVWKEIESRGYSLGEDISQGGAGKAQTRTVFGLQSKLRKLNLLKNKHLPDIFLLSSYDQRLDILRGFMDADGYYNKKRKRFVLSTTRENQVDFSVKLLSSLGVKTTTLFYFTKLNGKKIKVWDVCFTTKEFNPFLCRNENIKFEIGNTHKYRRIISIDYVESTPTICIEVDSPSNTFLFGESLIVTHNTNNEIEHKGYFKKPSLLNINKKHNLIQDNLGKYSVQFSLYHLLLEEAGFDIQGRILVHLQEDKKNKKLYKTYKTKDLRVDLKSWLSKKEYL